MTIDRLNFLEDRLRNRVLFLIHLVLDHHQQSGHMLGIQFKALLQVTIGLFTIRRSPGPGQQVINLGILFVDLQRLGQRLRRNLCIVLIQSHASCCEMGVESGRRLLGRRIKTKL